ncbi:MAG: aldo/keto reductase, partial [Streptomyces sp.]
ALAWVLAQGRDVVPIPGAKRERWAVQNAGAASIRLTGADLAEIAALPSAMGSWE